MRTLLFSALILAAASSVNAETAHVEMYCGPTRATNLLLEPNTKNVMIANYNGQLVYIFRTTPLVWWDEACKAPAFDSNFWLNCDTGEVKWEGNDCVLFKAPSQIMDFVGNNPGYKPYFILKSDTNQLQWKAKYGPVEKSFDVGYKKMGDRHAYPGSVVGTTGNNATIAFIEKDFSMPPGALYTDRILSVNGCGRNHFAETHGTFVAGSVFSNDYGLAPGAKGTFWCYPYDTFSEYSILGRFRDAMTDLKTRTTNQKIIAFAGFLPDESHSMLDCALQWLYYKGYTVVTAAENAGRVNSNQNYQLQLTRGYYTLGFTAMADDYCLNSNFRGASCSVGFLSALLARFTGKFTDRNPRYVYDFVKAVDGEITTSSFSGISISGSPPAISSRNNVCGTKWNLRDNDDSFWNTLINEASVNRASLQENGGWQNDWSGKSCTRTFCA